MSEFQSNLARFVGWLWGFLISLSVFLVFLANDEISFRKRLIGRIIFGVSTTYTIRRLYPLLKHLSFRNLLAIKATIKNAAPDWVDKFIVSDEDILQFASASRLYVDKRPRLGAGRPILQNSTSGNLILTSKRLMFINGEHPHHTRTGNWAIDTVVSAHVRAGGGELVVHTEGERLAFVAWPAAKLQETALAIRGLRGIESKTIQISSSAQDVLDRYDTMLGHMEYSAGFSLTGAVVGAATFATLGDNPLLGALVGNFDAKQLDANNMTSTKLEGVVKHDLSERGYVAQTNTQLKVVMMALRNMDPAPLIELIQGQYRPLKLSALCALRDMGPTAVSALSLPRSMLDDSDEEVRRRAKEAFSSLMKT